MPGGDEGLEPQAALEGGGCSDRYLGSGNGVQQFGAVDGSIPREWAAVCSDRFRTGSRDALSRASRRPFRCSAQPCEHCRTRSRVLTERGVADRCAGYGAVDDDGTSTGGSNSPSLPAHRSPSITPQDPSGRPARRDRQIQDGRPRGLAPPEMHPLLAKNSLAKGTTAGHPSSCDE
jgi:hypothetical protein